MDDIRTVLEGIAFGDDPKILPGDRLRAVEQLRALEPTSNITGFEREIHEWDEATIERELDDLCADEIAEAVGAEEGRPVATTRLPTSGDDRRTRARDR